MSSHKPSHPKLVTVTLSLAASGVIFAPHAANAEVLDDIASTLLQSQGGYSGAIISESGGFGGIDYSSATGSSSAGSSSGSIGNQVGGGVGNQVGGAIGNRIGGQLGNQVGDQIGNQISNRVGGFIDNKVGGAISDKLGGFGSIASGLFGGGNHASLPRFLSPFESTIDRYIGVAQNFILGEIGDLLGSIFHRNRDASAADAQSSVPNFGDKQVNPSKNGGFDIGTLGIVKPGKMGLPDFEKIKKDIQDKTLGGINGEATAAAQQSDRFNVNPIALTRSLASERDRTLAKTLSAQVLSDEGQAAMDEERQAAALTLESIQAKAEESQSMDVTQDVMKNLTAMVASQSTLESGNYAQTMLIHQQLSANGVVEANISEAVDETNRARHAEAMAGAAALKRAASGMYLPGS